MAHHSGNIQHVVTERQGHQNQVAAQRGETLVRRFGWNFKDSFFYAHRRNSPTSSVEGEFAVEAAEAGITADQTQRSGILALPVGTQAQVKRPELRIKESCLVMVPPFAVRADAAGDGAQDADRQGSTNHRFGRSESGSFNRGLTRSIHRSYVVKSGEGVDCSRARGGSRSAHRNTGRNSTYSEVLVRILCS